jgi:hypothetical protein
MAGWRMAFDRDSVDKLWDVNITPFLLTLSLVGRKADIYAARGSFSALT